MDYWYVGYFVDWLVGWVGGRLVGWLVGWPVGWLTGWLAGHDLRGSAGIASSVSLRFLLLGGSFACSTSN